VVVLRSFPSRRKLDSRRKLEPKPPPALPEITGGALFATMNAAVRQE
jgi:hypothetical protein